MITPAYNITATERVLPRLALDFLTGALDARITFTRASTATFVGSNGLIQTAAINAPRFDYNPTTLAANGLLVEEQRANLAIYSDDLTNLIWVKTNCTTAKTATGPDGVTNSATTLTASAANATALQSIISASAARSTTCYIKRRTGSGAVEMTQNNGTTWSAVTVTSSWTRVSIASATVANPVIGLRIVADGDSIDVALFQCETGSFATSAIPTVASQVTRTIDVAVMTGSNFSSWYNQTQGSFVVNVSTAVNGAYSNYVSDGTVGNYMTVRNGSSGTAFVVSAGSLQANFGSGALVGKTAIAYKLNDFAVSVNGGATATDTLGNVPTVSQLRIGAAVDGTVNLNGYIRSIAYYPQRLTNSELRAFSK